MVYVRDDIRALYLSRDTLSDLGVLFPNFPLTREQQQSLGLYGTAPDTEQRASLIRSITGGSVIPGNQDALCSCPQQSAVPSPSQKLPFFCRPKNNASMKQWLLSTYAASTFNTAHIGPYIAWPVLPLRSMSIPLLNQWLGTHQPLSHFTGRKMFIRTYFGTKRRAFLKKFLTASPRNGAIV